MVMAKSAKSTAISLFVMITASVMAWAVGMAIHGF
jgi:hypothetical protein